MTDRFALFERYCLPSVRAQTVQGFRWLVYLDSETPVEFQRRMAGHAADFPCLRVVYCDEFTVESVRDDIRAEFADASPARLVSTRLDNDDGLHRTFVETVQREQPATGTRALNFPLGVVYARGKTYLRRDESNPFLSLAEPFDGAETVWAAQHESLTSRFPTSQLERGPAWLQVVHGANVSNRVRGRRVPRAQALAGFGVATEEEPDRPVAILAENLTTGAGRHLREVAIAGVKRAGPVRRLLGS